MVLSCISYVPQKLYENMTDRQQGALICRLLHSHDDRARRAKLWEDSATSDVMIKANGKVYNGHLSVIGFQSPLLKKLIQEYEDKATLDLSGENPELVECTVRFMYGFDLNLHPQTEADAEDCLKRLIDIYQFAEKLHVYEMRTMVTRILTELCDSEIVKATPEFIQAAYAMTPTGASLRQVAWELARKNCRVISAKARNKQSPWHAVLSSTPGFAEKIMEMDLEQGAHGPGADKYL